jgi:predicted ATPase/class 3 adenylate cyclase
MPGMRDTGPTVTMAPARTATFLMTDIEGSTRLWEEDRAAMTIALEAHDGLLRTAVEGAGGTVVKTTGDGLLAAFDRPEAGLAAAIEGQQALEAYPWPTSGPLRVRMAVHSGSAEVRDGDFFGPTLNRVARLMAIGHGGQVLVSSATSALVADGLPSSRELLDLGEHRLRDLDRPEHVYQLVAAGLRREFPPLRSIGDRPTNLRPQVTTFVGRERELADLGRLVDGSRLVTLVGVGGTGKTRLELQLAADTLDRYRDGAWLVELAPISDPDLVVGEVARVLGVQPLPGRSTIDAAVDHLRAKALLLLLDNCEHVIGAVADAADRLLGSCPDLHLLASSREPLGVDGEVVFAVPSLALPPAADPLEARVVGDAEVEQAARSEAVRLFVDRAAATLPTFSLDRSNVRAVVDICRRLDGIPLALELAAARVNILSADEIARGLDDRFRLLTGGRRTAVPRQRTLQALIDWSWDLLDEADQRLLRRLSVFAGGWTLDAAAAVTGEQADPAEPPAGAARLDTLDGLGRLVDRSLVIVAHDAATRYGMLETIRQYAHDRLASSGEAAGQRTRHLVHFRRLAVDAEPGLEGPDMMPCLERLDAEIDNLRAALDWAFETEPGAALEMAVGLSVYWNVRLAGSEGFDRMNQAVDLARTWRTAGEPSSRAARSALAARVLSHAAQVLASYTGRPADLALSEEATAMAREAGDPGVIANTVAMLAFARVAVDGMVPPDGPEHEAASEALELAEQHGDWYRASIIAAAFALGESATDPTSAEVWMERATESARRTGNLFALGNIIGVRGRVASLAGRLPEAERFLREAQPQYRALNDRRFDRVLTSELAHVLRREGRLDEAEAEYRATIRGWQQSGNDGAVANQLECFAFIALARDQTHRAARLLGAAEALREGADAAMTDFERDEYDAAVSRLRAALGQEALASAWAEGRGMTADAAVAFALSP